MDDRDKERQREDEKKARVVMMGAMKSGNPFQLFMGKGTPASMSERVRAALAKGEVEVIPPTTEGQGHVVLRWNEVESVVLMTEWELERRALLQSMQQGRPAGRG